MSSAPPGWTHCSTWLLRSSLADVFLAKAEGRSHIPFRNSKLTGTQFHKTKKLLKDIEGHSMCNMFKYIRKVLYGSLLRTHLMELLPERF